jgi:hypothetical protein
VQGTRPVALVDTDGAATLGRLLGEMRIRAFGD